MTPTQSVMILILVNCPILIVAFASVKEYKTAGIFLMLFLVVGLSL